METSEARKPTKPVTKKPNTSAIRVSQETRKRLLAELAKINKKQSGRRVKLDALIVRLLPKLTAQDVTELQQQSLTGKDRMEQSHKAYCAKFGQITMDQFLAKLSEQAASHFSSENVAELKRETIT